MMRLQKFPTIDGRHQRHAHTRDRHTQIHDGYVEDEPVVRVLTQASYTEDDSNRDDIEDQRAQCYQY